LSIRHDNPQPNDPQSDNPQPNDPQSDDPQSDDPQSDNQSPVGNRHCNRQSFTAIANRQSVNTIGSLQSAIGNETEGSF
jgi:hypothetical protein